MFLKYIKRFSIYLLFVGWAIFYIGVCPASATSLKKSDAICPVCGNRFTMEVILSTNNFGGMDTDFLERARGTQPVLCNAVTCSKCYFSGHSGDFISGSKVPEKLKDAILKGKILRPIKDITKEGIPPWVSYDLIAQKDRFLGKDEKVIGDDYMFASWAVRLLWNPSIINDSEWEEIDRLMMEWIKHLGINTEEKNPAELEIDLAKAFAQAAKDPKKDKRRLLALGALALFRMHGENTFAIELLPVVKDLIPPGDYSTMEKELNESIEQERFFQRKALDCYDKILDTITDESKKSFMVYLCGELNRRLENYDKARESFSQAIGMKGVPADAKKFMEMQIKNMPQSKSTKEHK